MSCLAWMMTLPNRLHVLVTRAVQPQRSVLLFDDDRHPVVKAFNEVIRLGGDDGARARFLPSLRGPDIVHAGHDEGLPGFHAYVYGDPFLSLFIPFVKAVGDDEGPSLLEGLVELDYSLDGNGSGESAAHGVNIFLIV
jgi:hypothetical protein